MSKTIIPRLLLAATAVLSAGNCALEVFPLSSLAQSVSLSHRRDRSGELPYCHLSEVSPSRFIAALLAACHFPASRSPCPIVPCHLQNVLSQVIADDSSELRFVLIGPEQT